MTLEIGFLFAILLAMVYLFLTEKLPIDLTAFLGLVVMIFAGYLAPGEAFTGFASTAVITMLSIFIVSGALQKTGVADMIGGRVHDLVGSREIPLMIVIMLVAGLLSAFMFNIAATAVLMPAVASIARRAGLSPSRLFMPLAFGAILGGTTTVVGTPPNILVAEMLRDRGLEPFHLFDFTQIGIVLLGGGILFMITIGHRLLPTVETTPQPTNGNDLAKVYQLHERLFSIQIPAHSQLNGQTLAQIGLGETLSVQVVAIIHNGHKDLAPQGNTVVRAGDVLLVEGRLDNLEELVLVKGVEMQKTQIGELPRPARGVSGIRLRLNSKSPIIGESLSSLRFRERYGLVVVGIQRGKRVIRGHIAHEVLKERDRLLALGTKTQLIALRNDPDFDVRAIGLNAVQQLQEHLYLLHVPKHSPLIGTRVGDGRLSRLIGITIGGLIRDHETLLAVSLDEVIREGDRFLVTGDPTRIIQFLEMGHVDLQPEIEEPEIESDEVGVVEVALAPRSSLLGKTLSEMEFRDAFGLQALAIWRKGRPVRTNLAHMPLQLGDALLLQGSWDKIRKLAADPNCVVLTQSALAPKRTKKAPFALGALLLMIGLVVTGYQPIHVAAFTAATLAILSGALKMEEAYSTIEWRALFLVAAVLPVGIAMDRTGAAMVLANSVTTIADPLGPYAVLAAFALLSSLLSQGLDGAPAVVLLTPVALQTAESLGLSPYPLMMAVGLAASAGFITPFSQKASLLVMGAGGYKTMDYVRVGTPLTILVMTLLVLLIPVFFPF